jgi:hypothetical protein
MTEAERIHRGSLYLTAAISSSLCWFVDWWIVTAVWAGFFLWNFGRYVFMEPESGIRHD